MPLVGTAFLLLGCTGVWQRDVTEWNLRKEAGRKAFAGGRYAEAETLGRGRSGWSQRAHSADSPELAGCLNDLALAYSALGNPAKLRFFTARRCTSGKELLAAQQRKPGFLIT